MSSSIAETESNENRGWLGSSQQLSQISITDIPLQSTTIRVGESARDLDVILTLSCRCRHTWRLFTVLVSTTHTPTPPNAQIINTQAARTLIQAFISSRLDYCNSLLYGVSDNLIRRVQSVHNADARLPQ